MHSTVSRFSRECFSTFIGCGSHMRAELGRFFQRSSGQPADRLRSDVELPVPAQGSPLDYLFAQEQVKCCGNGIGALAQLFRQIALADDNVPSWVAVMDVASVG